MSVLIRAQPKAAVYVAATRQHVGKTSTCVGLLQGLTSRLDRIGFLKPVGQESVAVEGGSLRVDKDVAVAKEVFKLDTCNYADMSPVVIMPGYTKRFLDGHITVESQLDKIRTSFKRITEANEFTVVEGTGHTGVGSIVECNNARIAAELGVDMVLVANGGLGSAFDDLALNYSMCKAHNDYITNIIKNAQVPVLYVPMTTFAAMEKITHFTAKFNPTDEHKVHACGEHYASHIDFDAILAR
ncbi:hypothetical protein AM588_10003385 [Phytophthora nicotianae]|uniref:DRTGG domain-containing protein n=1 Tax=Phytophthora nicotianae TaxID=4792 RepID=A0A0W8CTD8_PHYNI|nr:hypothetical protein AM588_10003385 [Phytophthora nicotianae]